MSGSTAAPKVVELTRKWLQRYQCQSAVRPIQHYSFYPSRLISLEHFVDRHKVYLLTQNDSERFNINRISDALGLFGCQSDAPGPISKEFVGPYATVSHSWGGMEFLRLTPSKLKSFQRDGVQYLTRETGLARRREEQRWYWTVGLRRETEGQRVEG
jgi:hypothetical protein